EDQSRIHRTDGSVVYGHITAYDPKSKQFTIRDGMTQTFVKQDEIADMFLSPGLFAGKAPADSIAGMPERALRVAYGDGSRSSGTPSRIEDGHLTLACPGVKEPLRLPLGGVRSLIVLHHAESPPMTSGGGRPGRLEMDGANLKGRLVDGNDKAGG